MRGLLSLQYYWPAILEVSKLPRIEYIVWKRAVRPYADGGKVAIQWDYSGK